MNEIELTRLIDLAKSVPKELLPKSEGVFSLLVKNYEELRPIIVQAVQDSGCKIFDEIGKELRTNSNDFVTKLCVTRGVLLTRIRTGFSAPRAVCTLPGFSLPGIDDTLNETCFLIESATRSVYLMSYWMTQGSLRLIKQLAKKMQEIPSLHVVLIGDSKEAFLEPFEKMWPKEITWPIVYIFKPGMEVSVQDRSKMHAKTVIVDECRMLITSANLTRLAVSENIEVGISVEAPKVARQVSQMINELIHRADLFQRVR